MSKFETLKSEVCMSLSIPVSHDCLVGVECGEGFSIMSNRPNLVLSNGESFITIMTSPMQSGITNIVIVYQACDCYMKVCSGNVMKLGSDWDTVVLEFVNAKLAELVAYWNGCRGFVMGDSSYAERRPKLPSFVSCESPLKN